MKNFDPTTSRLGFHYFPDTLHYTEKDLEVWLPELQALGAGSLTLISPVERAIPEFFIKSLIGAGINPTIHLPITADFFLSRQNTHEHNLSLLFDSYARWGITYIALFDSPNIRRFWPDSEWAQVDLVERFLDGFLPFAEKAMQAGLTPAFPPLEPGGDYWDTAFLQSALSSLKRRAVYRLIDSFALSAFAWTYQRPLDWGLGGPERWPDAVPYHTPLESQDHLGFRIFEWYQAIIQAELGETRPILILRAGCRPSDCIAVDTQQPNKSQPDHHQHAEINLMIANELMLNEIPGEIKTLNFWLLSSKDNSPYKSSAWYQPDGSQLPVVNAMKQFISRKKTFPPELMQKSSLTDVGIPTKNNSNKDDKLLKSLPFHPIDHYLLLPLYAWGVADWDLDAIRPFIQEFHPTVGFSVHEACLAARVTILSRQDDVSRAISPEMLQMLHDAGCQVERYNENGILLAM